MTARALRPPARRQLPVCLLLAASLLAAGCGDRHGEGGHATTAQNGGTAVVAWSAEPGGVNELVVPGNALNTELQRQLFLHLVDEQPDFQHHPPTFAPQLARSYDWSQDHKDLTFHLRPEVLWSDGAPVTAEDVRWSWKMQIDPHLVWEDAYSKRQITDVEAVDPHTVRFH
ncbi:MAG: ABC transporter substrate-binding protein, partial [Acidobacteriota bacterium]|nr:ABC transporter substrate-binding protein [Acidobacteriota bacterium]